MKATATSKLSVQYFSCSGKQVIRAVCTPAVVEGIDLRERRCLALSYCAGGTALRLISPDVTWTMRDHCFRPNVTVTRWSPVGSVISEGVFP